MGISFRHICAACFCAVWVLFVLPGTASAAFPGTQAEKFPQVLPAGYLASLAEEKLEETLAAREEPGRHTLKLARKVQDVRCPAGALICEVELPRDIRYGGLTPVYVKAYVGNVLFRRVLLYYEVHVYRTLVVAAHDLRVDQPLSPGDVRVEEHEVANPSARYLNESEQLHGLVPKRVIRGGTPLTEDMLQTPVVMEVGAAVKIVSNHRGIRATTEGFAMQKGRIGGIIRVRNASSSKMLRARVVDATTVEVL